MTDPEEGARIVMGLVMLVLAILGALLVANASDDPMLAFGYALMIFGVAYIFGLVRAHYDAIDRAQASDGLIKAAAPGRDRSNNAA
jgi:uncharacterized membrane protein HdeD (DUF308 family)